MSNFVKHTSCPSCHSDDNLAIYDDGHSYCFGCHYQFYPNKKRINKVLEYTDLPDRGISKSTAEKYGVYFNENGSYVFPYCVPGRNDSPPSLKVRKRNEKSFYWDTSPSGVGLFGQQLFPPGSASAITITEGEFDALAASEMHGNRYPVVSLINGASGATNDVARNFEYLSSFDKIVIAFDSDEPGQTAANKVAALFPVGKVHILKLQNFKDANEYLLHDQKKAFVDEWWKAPVFTPSGLKFGKDMWDEIISPRNYSTVNYPWKSLNSYTYGIRLSELVVITADTGVGKTTFIKEIEHYLLKNTEAAVGLLHLEEPNADTCLGLMSIEASIPLHLPDRRSEVTQDQMRDWYDRTVNSERVLIWDHFGSNSVHEVLSKIRHMAALGCKYIVLDHLSIIVSDQSGDERKQLDEITTKLKMLCMELNIAVIVIVHQNRQGQIRGTAGVEQLANIVIKLIRDREAEKEEDRNVVQVIIQKNRFSGMTGPCMYLFYEPQTGHLCEMTKEQIDRFQGREPNSQEERAWA